jgi:ABC-type transporter Mla subunit MlaD
VNVMADILLAAGAFGAGIFCFVLSRRLTRFNDLEKGVGGAVAVLSAQVDDLEKALSEARRTAAEASGRLEETTRRAEQTARQLELLMAPSHDGAMRAPRESARSVRRTRRARSAAAGGEEAQGGEVA